MVTTAFYSTFCIQAQNASGKQYWWNGAKFVTQSHKALPYPTRAHAEAALVRLKKRYAERFILFNILEEFPR